jgi:hypothetical protein
MLSYTTLRGYPYHSSVRIPFIHSYDFARIPSLRHCTDKFMTKHGCFYDIVRIFHDIARMLLRHCADKITHGAMLIRALRDIKGFKGV